MAIQLKPYGWLKEEHPTGTRQRYGCPAFFISVIPPDKISPQGETAFYDGNRWYVEMGDHFDVLADLIIKHGEGARQALIDYCITNNWRD